jgi:hypothetical protein
MLSLPLKPTLPVILQLILVGQMGWEMLPLLGQTAQVVIAWLLARCFFFPSNDPKSSWEPTEDLAPDVQEAEE